MVIIDLLQLQQTGNYIIRLNVNLKNKQLILKDTSKK